MFFIFFFVVLSESNYYYYLVASHYQEHYEEKKNCRRRSTYYRWEVTVKRDSRYSWHGKIPRDILFISALKISSTTKNDSDWCVGFSRKMHCVGGKFQLKFIMIFPTLLNICTFNDS